MKGTMSTDADVSFSLAFACNSLLALLSDNFLVSGKSCHWQRFWREADVDLSIGILARGSVCHPRAAAQLCGCCGLVARSKTEQSRAIRHS